MRLLRQMIPSLELYRKNIAGLRGKQAVDPVKESKIKELVSQFYPPPPSERKVICNEYRKAMDSYIGKLKKG